MDRFRLVIPNKSHEEAAREYIEEFYTHNSVIHGVGGLNKYLDNYSAWLERLERVRNIEHNEELVPSDTYFLIRERDNRIVGMIDIRHNLNEFLQRNGGHIGYSIRPTERRQGYNLVNLYLALLRCQELGLEEVVLDADDWNVGSYRTMERLGGVMTNTYYDEEDNHLVRRYTINVNQAIENHHMEYEPLILR